MARVRMGSLLPLRVLRARAFELLDLGPISTRPAPAYDGMPYRRRWGTEEGEGMTRAVIRQVACVCASVGLLAAAPAQAQDPRIKIGGSAGWTLSDGVTFDGVIAGDG